LSDLSFLFSAALILELRVRKGEDPRAGKVLRRFQIRLATPSVAKISPARQGNSPRARNHRFEFKKCSQFLIRMHNETLSVMAMCINNPDCSPLRIHG